MSHKFHKTDLPNRTKTMRFYPAAFTGKERDEETGYGYFDARYMDHELMTMWLSVDPMADKYPSISPYNYCMWNPVKLIDPDRREVVNVHTRNVNKSKAKIAELQNQINNCSDKKQLKHPNKKLNTEQKTLNREMEYEKIVNTAIQDLKDYGMDDEFNKLDNLTDINGNKVDVYVEMVDNLGGFNGNCREHRARIASNGPVSSDMGDNSVHIFLSHKYRFIAGKTLAHEGGHASRISMRTDM